MMENPDQNSDYALRAIQEPRLRETEEFNQWISVPENKGTISRLDGLQRKL